MSIHYNPDAVQQKTCLRLIIPSRTPRPGARSVLGAFTTSCPQRQNTSTPTLGKRKKKNMKTHNTIKNEGQKSNENLRKADATLSDRLTERRKENERGKEGNDEEQDKEKINWKIQKKNVMLVINIY